MPANLQSVIIASGGADMEYTTEDVAREFGVSADRIRLIRFTRKRKGLPELGRMVPQKGQSAIVYTREEVEMMRPRPRAGRPPRTESPKG